MKIKQIGEYNGDIMETLFKNRGIENVELLKNPDNSSDIDPFKYHNMEKGANILAAHLLTNSEIGILVDSDADGFTSASVMYQYIKKVQPSSPVSYFLHDVRTHGLTDYIMDKVSTSSINLLIIPDAGSNDKAQIDKLHHMGIDVIIVDHHTIEEPSENCILINNQSYNNEESNRNLTGVGMVYKFCQAIDKVLNVKESHNFYDLIAIGQIGDVSDISENEVRNLVFKGLNNIQSPFVKAALKECFPDGIEKIAPKDLSFSIIPMINATIRVGNSEERNNLFKAMAQIDTDQVFEVVKRKKNRTTGKFDKFDVKQTIFEYAVDGCKRARGRQNSLVKKVIAHIHTNIYNEGSVAIGVLEEESHRSVSGLVANKISSEYSKPSLIIFKDEEKGSYFGSGRGNEKVLPSLRKWCHNTNLVEFASGHDNAFGIGVSEENFENFVEETKKVEAVEFYHNVDIHLKGKIDKEAILEVNKNKQLFGGKFHDPLFAFTEVKVNKAYVRRRGSVLTFFHEGVEFISFGTPEHVFDELTQNFDTHLTMSFVGRPGENSWGSKKTPQLVLTAFEKCENAEKQEESQVEITEENIVF